MAGLGSQRNYPTAPLSIAVGDLPSGIPATDIGAGTVNDTEFGYLNGLTAPIINQLGAPVTLVWQVVAGASLFAGSYYGCGSSTGSGALTPADVTPWIAPCAGVLSDFRLQSIADTANDTTITLFKSAGGDSFSYSATTTAITVGTGHKSGSDTTHTITMAAGDCIIGFIDVLWSTSGVILTARFTPSSAP